MSGVSPTSCELAGERIELGTVAGTDVAPPAPVDDSATGVTDEGGTTRPARWRGWLPGVLAVVIGTALICAHASLYGRWLVDDAAITFDYARNITLGYGPVLQPGAAPVEGYSNTSWLLLLMIGRWLGLFDHGTIFGVPDYVVFTKALAVVFCAGTLVACQVIATRLVRRAWVVTLGAGALLACIPSYVVWCFSGLENSLYGFLVAVIAAVTVRAIRDDRLTAMAPAITTGLIAFVAALTRPDGMIYVLAFPLVAILLVNRPTLVPTIRAAAVSVVAFAVPFGAFLVWRHAEFGRWVSNTAAAKSQSLAPNAQTINAFNKIGDLVSYVGVVGVLVALVIVGLALGRPSDFRHRVVGLLVPFGLAIAAFGVLNADWMDQYRFATPVWALGALVVTACAYHLFSTTGVRIRAVAGLGIVVTLVTSLTLLKQDETAFRTNPTVPMCLVVGTAGQLINTMADMAHLPNSASYLGPDLGGSSMTLRLRAVDLAGLADARIADYRKAGDISGLAGYLFGDLRPDVIQAISAWKLVGWDPRLDTDYYFLSDTDPAQGGLYIRKSVVTGPAMLDQLRATAQRRQAIADQYARAPLTSCGDPLNPGLTLGN